MEDVSMDDGAITVEGSAACQGELAVEDGSVGIGTIDADGAQARGVKGVSDVQGAQVAGGNSTMVSGSIVGAGAQLGAAEDVEAGTVGPGLGAAAEGAAAEGIPRPRHYSNLTKGQKKLWNRRHKWNGQYE